MFHELRSALEREHEIRTPLPSDTVLLNPIAGHALATTSLSYRIRKLGKRSGVKQAHPHRFRDSFAVDALMRGAHLVSVARMLADTPEGVNDHYVPFVEAFREQTKNRLNNGEGLEEYGRSLASQQPGSATTDRSENPSSAVDSVA